jgi:DNA-binding HxlR family transcriptional regulator
MTRREFGQHCGLARALELVGERWGLLIVRELLARPCRYTDLLEQLPGIPTNVLSARLKEFEAAGIAERRVTPAPQRGVVYALTPDGEQLEASVLALAVWGAAHLGEPRPGDIVPTSTLAVSLRALFDPGAAGGLTATWEIRTAGTALYAAVAGGRVATGVGRPPSEPDLIMTIPVEKVPTMGAILQAIAGRTVELEGRTELAETFTRVFHPPRAA